MELILGLCQFAKPIMHITNPNGFYKHVASAKGVGLSTLYLIEWAAMYK